MAQPSRGNHQLMSKKGKPFTRQLSKGVSEKKSVILCVQINMGFCKPNLAVETNFPNKFRAYLSSNGFLVGIFSRGVTFIRTTFAFQKCFG